MNNWNVLVVDDELSILKFLERILSPIYTVFTAPDAIEAEHILASQMIHLIISDIMMPGKDGITFCKELKQDAKYFHIPIILLTAKNTTQDNIIGLESGADVYMEKPFSNKKLLAQIESLLINRSRAMTYFTNSPLEGIQLTQTPSIDKDFELALDKVIQEHIDDVDLDIDMLARELAMSRATLYRKIISVTDKTPAELINYARLKLAAKLLVEDKHKVYEISSMVGYNSQSSFLRNFQKYFNQTPKQYIQSIKSK